MPVPNYTPWPGAAAFVPQYYAPVPPSSSPPQGHVHVHQRPRPPLIHTAHTPAKEGMNYGSYTTGKGNYGPYIDPTYYHSPPVHAPMGPTYYQAYHSPPDQDQQQGIGNPKLHPPRTGGPTPVNGGMTDPNKLTLTIMPGFTGGAPLHLNIPLKGKGGAKMGSHVIHATAMVAGKGAGAGKGFPGVKGKKGPAAVYNTHFHKDLQTRGICIPPKPSPTHASVPPKADGWSSTDAPVPGGRPPPPALPKVLQKSASQKNEKESDPPLRRTSSSWGNHHVAHKNHHMHAPPGLSPHPSWGWTSSRFGGADDRPESKIRNELQAMPEELKRLNRGIDDHMRGDRLDEVGGRPQVPEEPPRRGRSSPSKFSTHRHLIKQLPLHQSFPRRGPWSKAPAPTTATIPTSPARCSRC